LIVPLALAVTVIATIATLSSGSGCTSDKPRNDAGVGDGGADTPVI
jgi:hypothetical protein